MRSSCLVLFLFAALGCGSVVAQSADAAVAQRPGDASKSWQINFDRTAKSDGQISFLVWQNDQEAPTQIVVPVKQGQTENSLALATRDLFRDMLGVKDFETDLKKSTVFVRAKHGERRFSVKVGANTAQGVDIDLYAR